MNDKPKAPISKLIKRLALKFNVVIFVVVLVGTLIFCVLVLDNALNQPANGKPPKDESIIKSLTLDQSAINQLDALKTSSENTALKELPAGKTNPFIE